MKNFYRVIKYLLAMTVMIALVILLAACATIPYSQDIPAKVVEWNEINVWKVMTDTERATAFWIDGNHLITACHAVDKAKRISVQHSSRQWTVYATTEYCNDLLDIAILKYASGKKDDLQGFTPLPMVIADETPKRGARVYSAGYTLSKIMQLNPGYIQDVMKWGLAFSVPTEKGDSGSPVIRYIDGVITVVGVRIAVAAYEVKFGIDLNITYIAFMAPLENLRTALKEYYGA